MRQQYFFAMRNARHLSPAELVGNDFDGLPDFILIPGKCCNH